MPDPFSKALQEGAAIAVILIVGFFLLCGFLTH